MATLIAIGYPDETTATAAADEARRLAKDLIIQPDAIAVIIRDKEGSYHVDTTHHAVGGGAVWGMFWGFLFGLLFFIPVFGMAIGAGMGALFGKVGKTGIDRQVLEQMGDAVPPGKAGWFLVIGQMTEDKFLAAVEGTNAKLVRSNLSEAQEKELKEAFGTEKHEKE
jgi:uncharacterized membrane protein